MCGILKRNKYLVLVRVLTALVLASVVLLLVGVERGVELSFVTTTSKPLVFEITYTDETKDAFTVAESLKVSIPEGEYKSKVVLPVSKLGGLRMSFGKDCGEFILSNMLLKGKTTVHLNNLADFSIGQINKAVQDGPHFKFYSRKMFPYVVYNQPLAIVSKWLVVENPAVLCCLFVIAFFVFYKLVLYISSLSFSRLGMRGDFVFLTLFFILLFLPMLRISRQDKSGKENRMLAPFVPFIQNNQINSQFGINFEKWYNDHFWGRDILINAYDYLRHIINRNRGNNKVLIGKDGWLFTNASYAIDIYRHNNLFTEDQLEIIGKTLTTFIRKAKEAGVKEIYFYLSNDKESVYPEYYPAWIKPLSQTSGLGQVYHFLKTQYPDIKVFNFEKELYQMKQKGDVLFFKTDTHMTPLGSFYEYTFLMNEMKKDFSDLRPLSLQDFTMTTEILPETDLLNMLNLPVSLYGAENLKQQQLHWRIPPQAQESILTNSSYYQHFLGYNSAVNNNYKIVTLSDSFLLKYKAYLMETFQDVEIYFWGAGRPFEVQKTDCVYWQGTPPDILLVQTTERSLYRLLQLKYPCVD